MRVYSNARAIEKGLAAAASFSGPAADFLPPWGLAASADAGLFLRFEISSEIYGLKMVAGVLAERA